MKYRIVKRERVLDTIDRNVSRINGDVHSELLLEVHAFVRCNDLDLDSCRIEALHAVVGLIEFHHSTASVSADLHQVVWC